VKKQQISNLNAGHSVIGVLERHHDSLPEAAQECQDELVELTKKSSRAVVNKNPKPD
jgi:hypothetical protein